MLRQWQRMTGHDLLMDGKFFLGVPGEEKKQLIFGLANLLLIVAWKGFVSLPNQQILPLQTLKASAFLLCKAR